MTGAHDTDSAAARDGGASRTDDVTSERRGALLEARGLFFAYAPTLPEVVRDVSLVLRRGTLAALVGANGSGKSSLIRLLGGLLKPSRGDVLYGGAPLASIDPRRRARLIAYVPQAVTTVFPLTALEVVLTGRSPYTPRFHFESAQDVGVAREALAAVGAPHLAGRSVTELSGGERQLVSLARALAQEPECLLLDEPSAALDLKHRAALIRHLRALRDGRGITALVVTHDLQLLDPAFDEVFALREGALAARGAPREVLREEVLAEVYADEHVRARQAFGRTFVWSE